MSSHRIGIPAYHLAQHLLVTMAQAKPRPEASNPTPAPPRTFKGRRVTPRDARVADQTVDCMAKLAAGAALTCVGKLYKQYMPSDPALPLSERQDKNEKADYILQQIDYYLKIRSPTLDAGMLPKFARHLKDKAHKTAGQAMVCFECRKPANKRCAACAVAVYCSRECQAAHYTHHKPMCKWCANE